MSLCAASIPDLYDDALSISFSFRRQIWNVFSDVIGLKNIDYISINIADPDGKIIFFTSNPSFDYNFFCSPICSHDKFLSPDFYKNKSFYSWEDAFDKKHADSLRLEKLEKYKLKYGFCFIRKAGFFHIIYSFATKSKSESNYEYYLENANDMLRIGDICYQELKELYNKISNHKNAPSIFRFVPFEERVIDIFEALPSNILLFNTAQSRDP